jgi:hypothetical protein
MDVNCQLHASAALPKPWYTLDKWLGVPQSRSGRCGEEKTLDPAGNQTPAVQLVALRYTERSYPDCKDVVQRLSMYVDHYLLSQCTRSRWKHYTQSFYLLLQIHGDSATTAAQFVKASSQTRSGCHLAGQRVARRTLPTLLHHHDKEVTIFVLHVK